VRQILYWLSLGGVDMQAFKVTMGVSGGGSGRFVVVIYAATPDMARRIAMHQNFGYAALAVKSA